MTAVPYVLELGVGALMLIVFAVGVFGWSAPAMAAGDTVTNLGSFSDPRNAMPARPGHTITRVRMAGHGARSTQPRCGPLS